MPHVEIDEEIAAPPGRVWAALTDAPRLVAGGLGVTRLDGVIAPGARLKLWSQAAPGRAFALRVGVFHPPAEMTWEGGMPFGLFRGVRRFTIEPTQRGSRFRMSETFSGPLAGLILRATPDLTPSFRTFARGLKALAEGDAA
ncbi:MAG: SRPBCC domain-containing protein [Methylobacteriaceae bacterium]|nr:SRPBCC domain-containing protein [Methylobacteriaceae bacterium]